LRPAIIGSSLTEPYPGWTDTFSAAGGLTLAGGMGIINYVPGDERNVADLVPVDYVSNSIIAATALYANKPGFNIVTVGTSHKNPLTWGKYASTAFRYLSIHPFENTPFEPGARFISNNSLLKFLFFMRSELPTKFYDIVASLPFVGGS
jgi:fatty acyl-CoA reductase